MMLGVAEDLLDRILAEIRERKRAARSRLPGSAAVGAGAGGTRSRVAGQRRRPRALEAGSVRSPAGSRAAGGRARRGANREVILAAVRERPGATAREIADATGIARTTVASTVTRLAANGVLERSELPNRGIGFRTRGAPSVD